MAKRRTYLELRTACLHELGWALFYLEYMIGDNFAPYAEQGLRVRLQCVGMRDNWYNTNAKFWAQFLKEIEDETENLL